MNKLLLRNLGSLIGGLIVIPFDGTRLTVMPEIRKSIYVVDALHGDGGVQWMAPGQKYLSIDLDPNTEIPIGGNPKAEDLITGYWGQPGGPRSVVKRLLAV
jgi:hypothetical protein